MIDHNADMLRHLVSIMLLCLCVACSRQPEDIHETRFMMGTLVQFTIADAPHEQAMDAIKAAADAMQDVERAVTIYGTANNPVKAFNALTVGSRMALPEDTSKLLEEALRISSLSHGAFSPLLGKLSLLWGFSLPLPPHTPPEKMDIQRALSGVNANNILHHAQSWQRLDSATWLDFGGIAKGYAIDRGIEILRKHGIYHAIVDAGGDLRAIGTHHGKPWRIGIRHPRKKGKVLGWFEVSSDTSIVTSGDYERFFIYQGIRYHHILNPQTGLPARTSMSATIVAQHAMQADAWSTALFVLGKSGMSIVKKQGMQAVLMDAKGVLHIGVGAIPFHTE